MQKGIMARRRIRVAACSNPLACKPRSLYTAPPNMPLWAHSADTRYLKCATVSFDADLLQERLGISNALGLIDTPRVRFSDERLWTLIELLTDAIDDVEWITASRPRSTAAVRGMPWRRP